MGNLFIIFMIVSKSLQFTDVGQDEKYCECYDRCQRNFTTNAITNEQSNAACERGCRFYSLVFRASHDADSSIDKAHAKERCATSCTQSYTNLTDVTACSFGCSSMILEDEDDCTIVDHSSEDVIEFLFDDSSAVIHLEEPELDDVLIDIALKKQLESSLGSILDPKQKLPEISFKNLPITKEELSREHTSSTVKCPRFYELYVKLVLRNRSLTPGDLYFVGSVLIFAIICFLINRYLEKHRKLWNQILINVIHDRPGIMKIKDRMVQDELMIDCLPEKEETENFGDTEDQTENPTNCKYEDVTVVFYENDDSRYHAKPSHNNL